MAQRVIISYRGCLYLGALTTAITTLRSTPAILRSSLEPVRGTGLLGHGGADEDILQIFKLILQLCIFK